MIILRKYIMFNLLLILYHGLMFIVSTMGFSESYNSTKRVLLETYYIFCVVGGFPNIIYMIANLIRKKEWKWNIVFGLSFASLLFLVYYFGYYERYLAHRL